MPGVNATFGQLIPPAWRDVQFPTSNFTVELRHDLARHEFVDADGANLEGTGRAPYQFTFTIPFLNGMSPGPTERWAGQTPYPELYRQFIAACVPHTTGALQHPEFGTIRCKVESVRTEWAAERRDGVIVHAVFIETIDDPDDIDPLLGVSPITQGVATAQDLDTIVNTNAALKALIPKQPQYQTSFSDMMRSIQGAADTVSNASARVQGTINQIEYRVNAIRSAVDRANDSLLWPTIQACERMQSVVNAIRKAPFDAKKKIGFYVTKAAMTLAGVSNSIPADVMDVMKLNPALVAAPVVAAGTTVRYYAT